MQKWPSISQAFYSLLGIIFAFNFWEWCTLFSHLTGPPSKTRGRDTESVNGPLSDILAEMLSVLGDPKDKSIGTLCFST